MELLERYLQAIKFWLPQRQKQDIIAELSEDLHSQIEDKEGELGRKLNDGELEAILKQRGSPLLVANRYLPQQYLIGPVLFPVYRFVLKIVALCYLVPWVLVWIGLMILDPAYRAHHTGAGWIGALLSAWSSLWFTALVAVGMVTIAFAALERVQAKSRSLEHWNPRKLPPVRDPSKIVRGASLIELAMNAVFCSWWAANLSSRVVLDRPEVRILLSPVWRYFFWGFLVLALVNIGLAGVNLMRPYWTGLRAAVRLATDCIGSGLFCWLLKANLLAEISVPNAAPARMWEITKAINLWMERALPVAIIVGIVIAASDIYRIVRVKTTRTNLTQNVVAAVV